MKNIVFMGTPEFAIPCLEALIEKYNVVLVVSQPDRPSGRGRKVKPTPIKKVAIANNIEVYQPALFFLILELLHLFYIL